MSKHFFCYSILSLVTISSSGRGLAQEQPTPSNSIPDSARLKLVFPSDGDTLNFDRIRYAGSVRPGADAFVQGRETRVYETGAFVGMVDLESGYNKIVFTSKDSLGEVSDTLTVFREAPLVSYPATPTVVNTERLLPATDVYVMPGGELDIALLGSPSGRATFSLDKLAKNIEMVERPARGSNDLRGVYSATIIIPRANKYKPRQVEFKFRGKDGRTLKLKSRGRVYLLSETVPLLGVTTDSTTLVLTEPGGEIWMTLPSGIKTRIVGERDGFRKVRFAENVVGYIDSSSLDFLPAGTATPSASVGSIGTIERGDWLQLRINLTERVPFRIEQIIDSPALEVVFYGARQAPHWITYPRNDDTVRLIKWRQESEEIFVLRIELNQRQQWGHWGRYAGNQFWLNIRQTPKITTKPDEPLKGLTIAVDPGHGGEFEGAVSPTGLLEKDVNLRYALLAAEMLEAAGAEVVRTRTSDTTMTLEARLEIARDAQAHILLSLHNNSIGAATNPTRPRGTSTYYTVPHSQTIGKAIYNRLLDLKLRPYGRVSSTYFVTRQTDLISLIVEGAFMSHPQDEILLLNDSFLADLAKAVVDGVKDFVAAVVASEFEFRASEADKMLPAEPGRQGSN